MICKELRLSGNYIWDFPVPVIGIITTIMIPSKMLHVTCAIYIQTLRLVLTFKLVYKESSYSLVLFIFVNLFTKSDWKEEKVLPVFPSPYRILQ